MGFDFTPLAYFEGCYKKLSHAVCSFHCKAAAVRQFFTALQSERAASVLSAFLLYNTNRVTPRVDSWKAPDQICGSGLGRTHLSGHRPSHHLHGYPILIFLWPNFLAYFWFYFILPVTYFYESPEVYLGSRPSPNNLRTSFSLTLPAWTCRYRHDKWHQVLSAPFLHFTTLQNDWRSNVSVRAARLDRTQSAAEGGTAFMA